MTSDVPYERPRSTAITAGGFAERIQLLSRHHDTPLEPNAGVDTDVLWNRLYKTLNETIAEINSEIGIDSVGMIVRTLQNITNLTVIEVSIVVLYSIYGISLFFILILLLKMYIFYTRRHYGYPRGQSI